MKVPSEGRESRLGEPDRRDRNEEEEEEEEEEESVEQKCESKMRSMCLLTF